MTSQSAATLRSRYVVQAASDLEENRRRQEELAERLKLLQQEETLLIDILALADRFEDDADDSPLPEQAQDESPVAARTRSRGKSAPARSSRTGGTGAAKTATKGKSQRPLLGDLLMELLAGHKEPRPAKELRDELLVKHPDREPTPQVVRNTLESLVAKGRIRRHKHQRAVMYTLRENTQQGAETDTD
ncbi:hypothetical protein [Streptomyces sp. NPDC047046]|uniref:hypothetical protein n=1 Tax=Streptomyces sp. NPDC047046 TaxID=3155378 RepID=UPI0033F76389